jgi:hypothetical protein
MPCSAKGSASDDPSAATQQQCRWRRTSPPRTSSGWCALRGGWAVGDGRRRRAVVLELLRGLYSFAALSVGQPRAGCRTLSLPARGAACRVLEEGGTGDALGLAASAMVFDIADYAAAVAISGAGVVVG